MTYYAYDPDTLTYWAGASLKMGPNPSERAQISGQDAGSYILYKKIKGGEWTAFNIGWNENPKRRITSFVAPRGLLTKPGMKNHSGDHSRHYPGFPQLHRA